MRGRVLQDVWDMLHRMMDDPPPSTDPTPDAIAAIAAAGDRPFLCASEGGLGDASGCPVPAAAAAAGVGGSGASHEAERAQLLRRVRRAGPRSTCDRSMATCPPPSFVPRRILSLGFHSTPSGALGCTSIVLLSPASRIG